ncbi:hypothetical protein [Acinetobacter silvestris]|uniref:Uncharacterized protein n=1 Tax=Acinetobacter silvestris TaxID=1977882 RepID=A0A1Y3CGG2_9GAMM|nr:hypothetical protein [Acinetobacter silvestris]OTG65195.1 hypothetical protein B9T28_10450 [Acinetobacter silvestris]
MKNDALAFNTKSKMIGNTNYEGAYINRDVAFELHQVKVVVMQENQKQELLYQVILEDTLLTAQLSESVIIHSQIRAEATKFAQSIVAFHQDKDSYTLSLLDNPA